MREIIDLHYLSVDLQMLTGDLVDFSGFNGTSNFYRDINAIMLG